MDDASVERFRRADAVFDTALDLEPGARAAFVDRACAGDAGLRSAVVRLLRAHDRTDPLFAGSAAEFAAPLIDAPEGVGDNGPSPHPVRIGPYRIERELGRGGMGVVYLAERDDPHFRQRVALKVVRSDPLDVAALIPRFLAERQLLATLEHPNIARLFDGGVTPEGLPYYTMAFCEGGSLADRIAGGARLPLEEAVDVARQLAAALAAAHALGIVHRDVKPANVLFDGQGRVRLSDFGVAKLLEENGTRSGAVVGTVAYLAPEQVGGAPVDARADLWALGVTMYEMLTGRRPFDGPSFAAVLHAIAAARPSAAPLEAAGVPEALSALVLRLLEKDPADRLQGSDWVLDALNSPRATSHAAARPARLGSTLQWTVRRRRALAVGAGVLVLAGIGGTVARQRRDPASVAGMPTAAAASVDARPSLAVLPFANVGGDPANEYFSDGLTDELIRALSRADGLRVAGRASVFSLRNRDLDVRDIADTLGVASVVRGSVRRAGGRIQVDAQLLDARDGTVLWSETYDRAPGDIFTVQDEIARAIASALRVRLAGPGGAALARHPPVDPAAYELYLKGRHVFNTQINRDGTLQAIRYFTDATARDPVYARAHAGLSSAYGRMALYGYGRPREEFDRVRAAAQRALELDPTLAEAHASLAHVLFVHDFRRDAAEREFRRAIALDPGYTQARVLFAICLQAQARFAEAIAQLDTARANDPLAANVYNVLGRVYLNAGDPDAAIRYLREALRLSPQLDFAYQQLGHAYLAKGMAPEAIVALRRAAELSGIRDSAQLAYAYAVTGRRAEAVRVVRTLVDPAARRYVPPFHIAMAYAGLDEMDEAFRWLDAGYTERAPFMDGVMVTAAFAPLHNDPRWNRLLRRMGLDPAAGPRDRAGVRR